MTWVRTSDDLAHDRRWARMGPEVGPLAFATFVAALGHCNAQLTDGVVDASVLGYLGPASAATDVVVSALVEQGFWRTHRDGFEVVDYLKHQPSREKVEATRSERAKAGATGGRRSGESRRSKDQAKTKQVASRRGNPRPGPSGQGTGTSQPCRHGHPNGRRRTADGSSLCPQCCDELDQPLAAVVNQ